MLDDVPADLRGIVMSTAALTQALFYVSAGEGERVSGWRQGTLGNWVCCEGALGATVG